MIDRWKHALWVSPARSSPLAAMAAVQRAGWTRILQTRLNFCPSHDSNGGSSALAERQRSLVSSLGSFGLDGGWDGIVFLMFGRRRESGFAL